jgi:hypothetical protein
MSPNTTPDAVAAEITRRLLPAYRVTLAEARELRRQLSQQATARDRLAHAIAAPLGANVQRPGPSVPGCDPQDAVVHYTGPLAGTATIPRTGGRVEFTLSVAADDAVQVAAFLATFAQSGQNTASARERAAAS